MLETAIVAAKTRDGFGRPDAVLVSRRDGVQQLVADLMAQRVFQGLEVFVVEA